MQEYELVETKITKVRVALKQDSLGKRFWHVQYRKKPKYFVDGLIWHNAEIFSLTKKEQAVSFATELSVQSTIKEAVRVRVKPIVFEVNDDVCQRQIHHCQGWS